MANLKSPKQFIEFLKEKGVYRQFRDNVKNNTTGDETDFNKLLETAMKNESMPEIFSDGFLWAETDRQCEGHDFWNALDMEWTNKYYEDYK